MSADLVTAIGQLGSLLRRCGVSDKADWLAGIGSKLAAGDAPEARAALRQQLAGGMGSLLDLALVPENDPDLTAAEAQTRLWDLVDRIDRLLGPP
jgi:hypothetical protein